jgi:hypothetical protein
VPCKRCRRAGQAVPGCWSAGQAVPPCRAAGWTTGGQAVSRTRGGRLARGDSALRQRRRGARVGTWAAGWAMAYWAMAYWRIGDLA